MTYLEKLINKYCPNGYEWVKLENIATFINGLKCKTKKDFLDGNEHYVSYLNVFNNQEIDFLPTSKVKISNNENQNCLQIGDVIFSGSSENFEETGYASVFNLISKNRIYLNSFCFAIRFNNENLFLPKFSKYLFNSEIFRNQLVKCINGVTRFNLSKVKFATINVPLIPLKIQEKIVEILERFRILEAELKAELKAELEARGKQFDFWKKNLLAKTKKFNSIKVKEIAIYQNGAGHERFFDDRGDFILVNSKFISTNGEVIKKVSKNLLPLKINDIAIVLSDLPNGKALAKTFFVNKNNKYALNQRICVLTIKDLKITNPKFLNYVLNRNIDLLSYDNGTDQTNLKKSDIENLKIYLPPLKVQNKIVSILDKLSEYSQEINSGLPAEIELRSKQFKYYRDQLLNFKNNE